MIPDHFSGRLLQKISVSFPASTATVTGFGREEFIGRELDAAEELTGVIGRSFTFFLRYTEVVSGNQHLHIAHDLYNDEQANSCINCASAVGGFKVAAIPFADTFGNPAAGFAAVVACITDSCRQCDRLCDLNGGFRQDFTSGVVNFLGRAVGSEHLHIAFAAVQNHLLAENRDTMYCNGAGSRGTEQIQRHVEEEGHVNGIEALIERNRLQIQVNGKHLDIPDADIGGAVYQFLLCFGEEDTDILKAVFIIRRNTL